MNIKIELNNKIDEIFKNFFELDILSDDLEKELKKINRIIDKIQIMKNKALFEKDKKNNLIN